MPLPRLEHANLTLGDPDAAAALMERLFGWAVRWSGDSIGGGRTVHVGSEESYLALYAPPSHLGEPGDSYATRTGLNHVGVVVDDLDAVEERVRAEGLEPYSFGEYEPGRRFYFRCPQGVEFEVVSYR